MASFYDKVYSVVSSIPAGKVMSYGQVAMLAGSPGAARAVGYALSTLPENTSIPWHRVINSKGGLSIRNKWFGRELQQSLLEAEGIYFSEENKINMSRYGV